MTKPRLMYFDAPVSRGEECRLALWLANVDFEDVRVKSAEWPGIKASTPFGAMPVLELPGKPALAQANAILVMIGREHDLHPRDTFEAARHEMMMGHVEDLRTLIVPTMRMGDVEKKAAREALVADALPRWIANTERQLGDGPFFAGPELHVVDLKLYLSVRWLTNGSLDHVPTTLVAPASKLMRVHDAVRDDARVRAWYARSH